MFSRIKENTTRLGGVFLFQVREKGHECNSADSKADFKIYQADP